MEVGDNQSLKIQVSRPEIEPRSSCSASKELNHSATAAPSSPVAGEALVYWLSSWLAELEVRSSIPGLAATISAIGYLLLPSRDMAERSLK